MRCTRIAGILFALLLVASGCDSIDLQPREEISSDAVFQDETLAKSYLHDIYSGTQWGFGNPMLAGLVDEAKNTHGHGDAPIRLSNMTPTNRGTWDHSWRSIIPKFRWADVYERVRDINLFLSSTLAI